jgi:hypothetical protein
MRLTIVFTNIGNGEDNIVETWEDVKKSVETASVPSELTQSFGRLYDGNGDRCGTWELTN